MKLLDWLARLGILRYGIRKAVYTSGKDRPIEFLMPGVFNADRDLGITDNLNPPHCPSCKAAVPKGAGVCPACGTALT